jgi:hypothetical protein
LLSLGDLNSARSLALEVVEGWAGVEQVVLTWGGAGAVAAIATLTGVDALGTLGSKGSHRSLWVAAARDYLAGNLERAADIYARIGSRPDEAYARLRAAGQLARDGDATRADAQRKKALEFYRSVGATRYIHEAEALGIVRERT